MNRPRFTLAIRRIIEVGFFAVKFEISLQSFFSSLYTLQTINTFIILRIGASILQNN